ncbi:MAG: hypothetical protein QY309_13290 [Cyclobacteriaceae bacterium]|nr:MAG: hypothetical protein QY309_13030 [Cyclobacteriaceae bacterium]WKZ58841.1 MAG: hypothetical protein QY309_13290 [Cyclobacteriaceae bacterium]
MRTTIYITFALLTPFISSGQIAAFFQVTDTVLTDSKRTEIEKLKKNKLSFYEDNDYTVSKTCSGEWGGTIRFKDKINGKEYSCEATCPVSVNKIDDNYIVTSSLAHLSGFTEIIKISDPKSMDIFQMPPPRKKKGKKIFRYAGDDESKSKKGTETLVDSIGVLALASFIFEQELFHVITDFRKTYIAKIENKSFVMVALITSERTWTYDNDVITTKDGHIIITIQDGYIDIFGNQVKVLKAS